jgi:hypothetical protein
VKSAWFVGARCPLVKVCASTETTDAVRIAGTSMVGIRRRRKELRIEILQPGETGDWPEKINLHG